MILTPLAIGIGLIGGLLRGGRIDAVWRTQVQLWPILLLGIALQSIGETIVALPGRPVIVAAGFICLVIAAMRNVHIPGAAVTGIGLTLNLAVLVVNGYIPVRFEALTAFGQSVAINPDATGLWRIENDGTSLALLGDIVPVPILGTAISFGDLIMLAGLIVLSTNLVLQGRAGGGIDVDELFGPESSGVEESTAWAIAAPGDGGPVWVDVDVPTPGPPERFTDGIVGHVEPDIDLRETVVVVDLANRHADPTPTDTLPIETLPTEALPIETLPIEAQPIERHDTAPGSGSS